MAKTLLIVLLAWACEKPKPVKIPDNFYLDHPSSNLKIVWKTPLSSSGTKAQSRQPLVYNDKLICNSAPNGEGFSIWLLDGESGSQIWTWNNFLSHPTIHWANHQFIYQDKYVFNNNNETNVLDLNSGTEVWQYLVPKKNGDPYITNIGQYIYHKHHSDDFPVTAVHLIRSPVNLPRWDTLLTLHKDSLNGYTPSIPNPTLWMNGGDSILLFQNRSWNFSTSDGQIDFYAHNLSQKKTEFILRDIEPTGNSNVLPPVVDGDRAYILGNRNLHCIDLENQSILWQKGFPGFGHHLMLSNLIVDGNKLIVKPDNDAIYAMDKYSGDLIWDTQEAGHSPSHMQYWNGMVFYTADGDGKLFAVQTSDGKIIWAQDSPHDGKTKYPSASFQNGVAINPQLGYIYAQDRHFMMCFKLPETTK